MVIQVVLRGLLWRGAGGIAFAILASPPAHAQSFFQQLFGFGSASKPAASQSSKAPRTTRAAPKAQPFSVWSAERQQSTRAGADMGGRDPAYGGSWRTVCVRQCDGYYWPVSRSVTRERFATDAKRCEASCAGAAKLYYTSKHSDDPRDLVDLQGNSYTKLKTAFAYRTTLISGCGCRPAPWSAAEGFRHDQYAAAVAAQKAKAAMEVARADAEKRKNDQIAQLLARALDEAESLPDDAQDAPMTVALAEPQAVTPSPVGLDQESPHGAAANVPQALTGYVHLHVLPGAAEAALEPATVLHGQLKEAVMEVAMSTPAVLSDAPGLEDAGPAQPAAGVLKPRRDRTARRPSAKPQKAAQQSWLGGAGGKYTWPGDSPRRAR